MATLKMEPFIPAQVKLHPDAVSLEDEWSGVTDPRLRRKLQNRLNQRATRRRKAALVQPCDRQAAEAQEYLDRKCTRRANAAQDLNALIVVRARSSDRWLLYPDKPGHKPSDSTVSTLRSNSCSPPSLPPPLTTLLHTRMALVSELHAKLVNRPDPRLLHDEVHRRLHPLPADHLLTLVYYNVYRALIANVAILGLDLDLMATEDYPSPFTPCSPTASSALRALPASLQPTELQKTMAHHPQWDIVPDAACRDNLLRHGVDDVHDVELCLDLIGAESRRRRAREQRQSAADAAGCIVWGDPWDIESWEMTPWFVRKYPWLFRGCWRVEASTNRWRRERGEDPLCFAELIEGVHGVSLHTQFDA